MGHEQDERQQGQSPHGWRSRLSVGKYVAVGFVACGIAIGALVGTATAVSFSREREHTNDELRSAAKGVVDEMTLQLLVGLPPLLDGLAAAPDLTSFDPASCATTMDSLRGGIVGARFHLFDPEGTLVCSLDDPEIGPKSQPLGEWFGEVQASDETVTLPAAIDQVSGHPAISFAVPVYGETDEVGVLLAVVYGGGDTLVRAAGVPDDTVILLLDAERELVLATTPGAFESEGRVDGVIDYAAVAEGRTTTVADTDGIPWVFTDSIVPDLGWHALAGRRESAAQAPARALLRTMALIGAGALLALALLGYLLRRLLVDPLRDLEAVAQRSARDDDTVRAHVAGPAELAALSTRFNELLDERQARERDLRWRAMHDVLTELPNRAALAERLTDVLTTGTTAASVLFVDLDRFKLVNDTHGHPTGDRLLIELAQRLRRVIVPGAILGRFGGDEFLVICPRFDEAASIPLARQIIEAVEVPFDIEGNRLHVSACVGIAGARPGQLADEVVSNADIAMYAAKTRGVGTIEMFDAVLRDRTSTRAAIERDLHGALGRDELRMHYQPIVDLQTGEMVGAEALMRWHHPERGVVPPDEFIEIADDSGLLVQMGDWALGVAATNAARWTEALGRPFSVAVNVAPSQLASGGLVRRVREVLDQAGIPPSLLNLEVTESSVLRDPDLASELLGDLRKMGVSVALDDFGTGYSSLSYLQILPLDAIKIDRSFVSRLDLGSTSNRIVRSVLELAEALDLGVIAEGVETNRHLVNLQRLGCRVGQGYLFARPMPADELDALLATGLPVPVVETASAT